jgi:hypothetical protein
MKIWILIAAVFAATFALVLLAAFGFRAWRNRNRRRSPLRGKLHHVPGQQLLDRIASHDEEASYAVMTMLLSGPMMFLAWALSRIRPENLTWEATDWIFVGFALLMFGFAFQKFTKHVTALHQSRDGLAAERMTAQQLNRLVASGCHVMHDVPGDGFNIDHVVVSPAGVYAVETKSFRKPKSSADDSHYKVGYDGQTLTFPDWRTSAPLDQARRQARWLSHWLHESLGEEIPVIPAVALPGWYIEPSRETVRSDVKVFSPMGRGATFMTAGAERHPSSQRMLVAQALALRYPEAGDDR